MLQNNLEVEQLYIMGGGTEVLEFTVLDRYGEPLDLATSSIIWLCSDIMFKETPIITKKSSTGGITIKGNVCSVTINKADTVDLIDAKYEHELIIEQPNGKVLRPCYGYIYIKQGCKY